MKEFILKYIAENNLKFSSFEAFASEIETFLFYEILDTGENIDFVELEKIYNDVK